MSRLSLLLIVLPLVAFAAAGCGSRPAPRAAFVVHADPFTTTAI